MMDHLLRDKLQVLTGLTKYKTESGDSVVLPADQWTTIYGATTSVHNIICAYKISCTNSTDHVMRLLAVEAGGTLNDSAKVFPFSDLGISFISDISSDALNVPLQIPIGYDYVVQVKTGSATAEAKLESISIIEVPLINYV